MLNEPKLLAGGLATDDRGELSFVNDFDFQGVRRFYLVANHRQGFVRAWHAHKREAKYVLAVSGAALVGAVEVDSWEQPSRGLEVKRFVLAAHKPSVLYIPAGYANGFMSLTPDMKLMFLSTSTLAESQNDDFRYDAHYWDIWTVVER
jgi:dTDP-4-dehydrorhamnose 3,5-epimerase